MKDYYSLIMKLISFTNNDVARYVDKNSDLKLLYLKLHGACSRRSNNEFLNS